MARQRDPRRDEAFEIWKQHNGEMKLKDIAEQLGVLDTQIRKWKSQDKWESPKGNVTNSKRNVTKQKENREVVVESEGLTDKQRLFCIYYIKSFNATQSAIKAGYSADTAHVQGPRLLGNVRVREEIQKVKAEMRQGIFIDAMDILDKYIKIAFSDITDYVQFGTRESPAVNLVTGEPLLDGNGDQIMQPYTYLDLGESNQVDGTLLTEVKQGRDGISVKLADKMKALEMLSKYFDLLSDNDKKKLQEEKLKVDIAKGNAEIDKLNGDNDEGPIEIMISRKGGR